LDGSFPQENPNSKLSGKTKKIDGLLIKIFDWYMIQKMGIMIWENRSLYTKINKKWK